MKSSIDLTENNDFQKSNFKKKSVKVESTYYDETGVKRRVPWKYNGTLLNNHEVTYRWFSSWDTSYTFPTITMTINNNIFRINDAVLGVDDNDTLYTTYNGLIGTNYITSSNSTFTGYYINDDIILSSDISSDSTRITVNDTRSIKNGFRIGKVKDIRNAYKYSNNKSYPKESAKHKYRLFDPLDEYGDKSDRACKIKWKYDKIKHDMKYNYYSGYDPYIDIYTVFDYRTFGIRSCKFSALGDILWRRLYQHLLKGNIIVSGDGRHKVEWPDFHDDYLREMTLDMKPRNDWRKGRRGNSGLSNNDDLVETSDMWIV